MRKIYSLKDDTKITKNCNLKLKINLFTNNVS